MTADPDSLSALTVLFTHRSKRYRDLPWPAREPAEPALSALNSRLIDDYKATVRELALDGWLTPTHAAVLAGFADVLV
jgi:hypothetical protein